MDKEIVAYTYNGIISSLKRGESCLKDIMLSDINLSQKDKYCMILLILKYLNSETEHQVLVPGPLVLFHWV